MARGPGLNFAWRFALACIWIVGVTGGAATLGCASSQRNRVGQALLLSEKGQTREAIQLLESHIERHPEARIERRLLIRLYGVASDLNRAEHHAERLAELEGAASPSPWIELGHAYELCHRFEEALALYDRAGDVAPKDPIGPRVGGTRSAVWGELAWAEPRLAEAVRRAPRDARLLHALGVVRLKAGDQAGAEWAYRRGVAEDPSGIDNHIGLATLALVRGDARAVLAAYDRVLHLKADFADAELGRAWALVRLARFEDARRALEQAERLGAERAQVERQRRWLLIEQRRAFRTHPLDEPVADEPVSHEQSKATATP